MTAPELTGHGGTHMPGIGVRVLPWTTKRERVMYVTGVMPVDESVALMGGSERMPVGPRVPVPNDSGVHAWTRRINNTRYRFSLVPAFAGCPARVYVERYAPSRGRWTLVHTLTA